MSARRKNGQSIKIGFWTMVRDVLTSSMSKGLFLPALLGVIVLVARLKMPADDVSRLAFDVLLALRRGELVGYVLFVIVLIAWPIHSRYQRRLCGREVKRTSDERTKIQEQAIGQKLESSER